MKTADIVVTKNATKERQYWHILGTQCLLYTMYLNANDIELI